MKHLPSVTKLLSNNFIQEHAIPSNIAYGKAIYKRRAVELIATEERRVEAWVGGLSGKSIDGGGSRRRIEFVAGETGLVWHCTGNPKDHQIFCKHCVALALELLNPRSLSSVETR